MTKRISISFLQKLKRENYKYWPLKRAGTSLELYLVDFSSLKLNFSDRTPLIDIPLKLEKDPSAQKQLEFIQDIARQMNWEKRLCMVLFDGNGQNLKVEAARSYFPRFVILDTNDQSKILSEIAFTSALLDSICQQSPLTILSPYQVGGPVEGSRFFGRDREINKILNKTESNFAIFGVRNIGKTSLLRETYRRLKNVSNRSSAYVWLDCSTISDKEEFKREIVRKLYIRELPHLDDQKVHYFNFTDFLERMKKMHKEMITIFLDEADKFLEWASTESDLLNSIRATSNAGHSRYVVAGFENLMNELFKSDGILFGLFEPLRIGPFRKKTTKDIVLSPMKSMRIGIVNEDQFVSRIHWETNGHPLIVQYYCNALIDQIENENMQHKLTMADIDNVQDSPDLKGQIIRVFMDNVGVEDKVLIYTLLCSFSSTKETFSQKEMHGALEKQKIFLSPEEIDRSCERLILSGTLIREGKNLEFANKVFPRLMQKDYDIEWLLSEAKSRVQHAYY